MTERCPCGLHDREVVFDECPIAKDARAAITLWEADPRRQALAKLTGRHPGQISDDDLRRVTSGAGSMRNPPIQQIPRTRRPTK